MLFLVWLAGVVLVVWGIKTFIQHADLFAPHKISTMQIVSPYRYMTKAEAHDLKINVALQKGIRDIRAKKIDLAIQDFTALLKQEPNNIPAWIDLGVCYHEQKNWQKSNEAYQKVISIKPKFALARYNLAFNYCDMGDFPKAIQEYKNIISYAPYYAQHLKQTFQKRCPALKLPPALAKMPPKGSFLSHHHGSPSGTK